MTISRRTVITGIEAKRVMDAIERQTVFVLPDRVDGKPFDMRPGALNFVDGLKFASLSTKQSKRTGEIAEE